MTTATAITLTTAADGSLEVHSPYHPDFPAAARALGGRWRPSRCTWVFDGRDEAVVGDLLARLFGWSPAPSGEVVTVRVTLSRDNADGAEARLAGRVIARRPGRDEAVVLSAGVVVVGGAFAPSAGSRQHPALIDSDEAVTLEVRDLPVEALSAARELEWTRPAESAGAGPDRAALLAERNALLTRLAELDALLGGR